MTTFSQDFHESTFTNTTLTEPISPATETPSTVLSEYSTEGNIECGHLDSNVYESLEFENQQVSDRSSFF